MEQLTKDSLKYMIDLEILKAEEAVNSSNTIRNYSRKLVEYKKAKQLKQLVNEFEKGQEHVIALLEEITNEAII
ncbi:hypothetical protein AC622_15950 [Bacillus sp. FJAT-27916]|uniref:hypothetical protein n=1 Tax=Bacillaceae TaxID=186817 RepID=UPI000670E495|nr:hypothetical protein [Bacillus sp. FJAT-27916]KMY45532.1 hypothetical protein AC622_15950 [Bacillus sp. FJAT-27916]